MCAIVCSASARVEAQLCETWTPAAKIGELPALVREASGMAASSRFQDRLYHINDSGDAGRFYVTRMDGGGATAVRIAGFRPQDTEAMSLGACPDGSRGTCLYVGDIGDNPRRRSSIEIAVIEEAAAFAESVVPVARIRLRYPDGPHDAESMAVHPDGTLFVLTKERPARLYKAATSAASARLAFVATLDTGTPPTDMAISSDGTRLLVLTYRQAIEFTMDLEQRRTIPLSFLQQQESVAYLPGSRSFIYTTERALAALVQPIMKVACAGKVE